MPAFVLPSVQRKDGRVKSDKYDERRDLLSTIDLDQLIDLVSTNEGRASIPFGTFSAYVFDRISDEASDRFQAALLNDFSPSDIPQFIEAICRAEPKGLGYIDSSTGADAIAKLVAVVLKHGNTKQVKKLFDGWHKSLHNLQRLCAWAFDDDFQPRKNFWLLVENFKDQYLHLAYLADASESHPIVHQEFMTFALTELLSTKFAKQSKTNQNHAYRNLLERLAGLDAAKSLSFLLNVRSTDKESLEVCFLTAFYIGSVEFRTPGEDAPPNYEAGEVLFDAWKSLVSKASKSNSDKMIEIAADELLLTTWGKFDEQHEGLSELLAPHCSTKALEEVAALMEGSVSNGHIHMAPHLEVIGDIARKRASGMTGKAGSKEIRL